MDRLNHLIYNYFGDKYRIIQHLLFWLIYFADLIQVLLDPSSAQTESYIKLFFYYLVLDVALIYINLYWFIPKFLLKSRIWLYFSVAFVSLLINVLACTWIGIIDCGCMTDGFSATIFFKYFTSSMQNTIFFLGTAIGLKLFKIWIRNQRKIQELQHENLRTELNYLKSQMNPHFLFNTLNNIYVQTKIDHQTAAHTILKLSDILRYQLYDCSKERVKLSSEIEYLQNYLELEKIRKTKLDVRFDITGKVNGVMIAPFILIPFIENAIKHGTTGETAYVSIKLTLENKVVDFVVENSVHETIKCVQTGGLGLANVKRRLELLYPAKYQLDIEERPHSYYVKLNLTL